jgi:hypothetical protein
LANCLTLGDLVRVGPEHPWRPAEPPPGCHVRAAASLPPSGRRVRAVVGRTAHAAAGRSARANTGPPCASHRRAPLASRASHRLVAACEQLPAACATAGPFCSRIRERLTWFLDFGQEAKRNEDACQHFELQGPATTQQADNREATRGTKE